ncbi:ATP-grasp domain-containing protein [Virgibacillus sp. AGTR]|uniref:ATP-grasp domain-containing protein n=1 Tax=Virgibacillus sp. AGTR TaxID=2812055 RepID=UPI001D16ED1E|nr:ATP-grasp domain-containing protein [Virgibacillus sp. AGTR]MCC2252147.1 ATP-grasp domain-containing protein [Virgibacillus sp. AGTR]
MKILILIATRNTHLLDIAYQHAINKGHEVYTLNTYKDNKNDRYKGVSQFDSFTDPDPFVKVAETLQVDKVVCISAERTLERDALIKQKLETKSIPVVANPLEVIKNLSYKDNSKNYFQRKGVPTASGKVVTSLPDVESHVNQHGYPFIMKKSRFSGGMGNQIIKNNSELNQFLGDNPALDEGMVIEKYVSGVELSMEIVGEPGCYTFMPMVYKGATSVEGIHPLKRLRYTPFENQNVVKRVEEILAT